MQTFPAGEARYLNRSASVGLEAWAARATKAAWKCIVHTQLKNQLKTSEVERLRM